MAGKPSRRLFIKQGGATALSVFALPNMPGAQTKQTVEGLKTDVPADKLIANLRTFIPDLMKQVKVPGVSIALIRAAKILWIQGFGVKSATTKEPVTPDTPFEAASLSLPAFAYATLKLSDQGKLKLDAPLWNYLPDYFLPADDPNSKLITARMILSHTSGLRARPEDKKIKLFSTPGEKWSYSVLGYGYLQRVVEHIAGGPLEVFMQKNLLQPLGMQNSSYDWNEKYEKTAAKGHNEAGERVPGKNFYEKYRGFSAEQKARIRDLQPEDAAPSAAFSLTSTAADYARFMIEIIQSSQKDRSHLPENFMAEMLKPQAKVTDAIAWGLGWGLEHTADGDAFWHWGNASTLQHFAIGYRKQGIGVVIMTNSSNGLKLCRELTPQVIGSEHSSFSLLLK
jgi:CubicO group peptidase (beta-lactamase class C family)